MQLAASEGSVWADIIAGSPAANAVGLTGGKSAGSYAAALRYQCAGLETDVAIWCVGEGRIGTAGQTVGLLGHSCQACNKNQDHQSHDSSKMQERGKILTIEGENVCGFCFL